MNNINIDTGMTIEKKISTLIDSRDLINQILDTYYGTPGEKSDIKRNIDHINQLLSDPDVLSGIEEEILVSLNEVKLRSESILQS